MRVETQNCTWLAKLELCCFHSDDRTDSSDEPETRCASIYPNTSGSSSCVHWHAAEVSAQSVVQLLDYTEHAIIRKSSFSVHKLGVMCAGASLQVLITSHTCFFCVLKMRDWVCSRVWSLCAYWCNASIDQLCVPEISASSPSCHNDLCMMGNMKRLLLLSCIDWSKNSLIIMEKFPRLCLLKNKLLNQKMGTMVVYIFWQEGHTRI